MTPLISIILTSYNHEAFLKQAIESLLSQSFKDFELIIIDDCSTDNSQNIIRQYSQDSRVNILFNKHNSGSYVKATNIGANLARGQYYIFAQCDDFANPNQLEELYKVISKNQTVGVVFSSSAMIDENGNLLQYDYDVRSKEFKSFCSNDSFIDRSVMRNFLIEECVIPNLSAALIRKECFRSVGLSEDYLVVADWLLWLKLTNKCDFYFLKSPYNNFRQHSQTIRSKIKIKKQILEIYQMFYSYIDFSNGSYKEKCKIKISAASIWLRYSRGNRMSWIKSFISVFSEVVKRDILNIVYIPIGFVIALSKYVIKSK